MSEMAYVEVDTRTAVPRRIFKSKRVSYASDGGTTIHMRRADAVSSIRHQIFLRSKGDCEICTAPLTESSGHMHEQIHRGQGGEISLANSVFICAKCHRDAHKARNPQWSKNQ